MSGFTLLRALSICWHAGKRTHPYWVSAHLCFGHQSMRLCARAVWHICCVGQQVAVTMCNLRRSRQPAHKIMLGNYGTALWQVTGGVLLAVPLQFSIHSIASRCMSIWLCRCLHHRRVYGTSQWRRASC